MNAPRPTPTHAESPAAAIGRTFTVDGGARTRNRVRGVIVDCTYHRNGVGGVPYYLVLIDLEIVDSATTRLLATVFASLQWATAVIDPRRAAGGDISFGEDGVSIRGDLFDTPLRAILPVD